MVVHSPELSTFLQRLDAGNPPSEMDIMDFARRPGAIDELLALVRAQPLSDAEARQRRGLMRIVIEAGRVLVPGEGDVPELPSSIVTEPRVVQCLVELLFDEDKLVRGRAFRALVEDVPASSLQPYADSLHRQPHAAG